MFGLMNHLAQYGALLLTAALALTACKRHGDASRATGDSATRETIIGTWGLEFSNAVQVVTLWPDSSFTAYTSNTLRPRASWYGGQWAISNGVLLTKCTNASYLNHTNDALGREWAWKIFQITPEKVMFSTDDSSGIWERKH